MCLADLLEVHSRADPAAPAILSPGRPPLTYGELSARTHQAVHTLRGLGIAATDRVAVALPRGADSALALLAVATAAACVPINPDLTADELLRYFSELKLTALVTRAEANSASRDVARSLGIAVIEFVPGANDDPADYKLMSSAIGPAVAGGASRGEDDAFILLTSGTAARPKMVPLTHANVCLSAYNAGHVLSLAPHDCLLLVLPLFHAHGLISGLLTALAAGSSVICTDGFDVVSFFGWMKEWRPTWYTAVPTIHRALLTAAEQDPERARPSSLRVIRSASSSLAPAILEGLEAMFGVPVLETYGMTEAASQIAANPFELRKVGSVGRAAGPEIAIMDEAGTLLRAGEAGEIVVRGANVTRGYVDNPEANARSFTNGWFRTGDQGRIDDDGYVRIIGRIKEMINRGGEKVSPLEVDVVLMEHPAVLTALTFSMPHDMLGEEVAAAVVLKEGKTLTERELRDFAGKHLVHYKVPHRIVFVSELPRGPTGKLQRIGLARKLGLCP